MGVHEALNDPRVVRNEYLNERRLRARREVYSGGSGQKRTEDVCHHRRVPGATAGSAGRTR